MYQYFRELVSTQGGTEQMKTLATKQPSNQDFIHQEPVRATAVPGVRS